VNRFPAANVYMGSGPRDADTTKGFTVSAKLLLASIALGAISLLTVSACTGEQPDDVAVPSNAAARSEVPKEIPGVTLTAVAVEGLGTIVTDQDGLTLYRFNKDEAEPSKSNCDGECAAMWLPVIAEGEVAVTGLDKSVVGTVARSDGAEQVTIGGWPIYRFIADTAPGDLKGQGISGTWFAIAPDGSRAGNQSDAPPPPAPQDDGVQLVAADLPGFGPALTDQDGRTLYLFNKDSKAPSKSTCDGACAAKWPPVIADGDVRVTGVDKSIVGTVTRADGTEQVTVGGWPVYRFAGDDAAGQTNGHGVGGTWFVIEPLGCKSAAPVAKAAPAPAPETAAQPDQPDQPDQGTGY